MYWRLFVARLFLRFNTLLVCFTGIYKTYGIFIVLFVLPHLLSAKGYLHHLMQYITYIMVLVTQLFFEIPPFAQDF